MKIEGYNHEGEDIMYHAQAIRDAIRAAVIDGFHLDVDGGAEIEYLDLNATANSAIVSTRYVSIVEGGVLKQDLVAR